MLSGEACRFVESGALPEKAGPARSFAELRGWFTC